MPLYYIYVSHHMNGEKRDRERKKNNNVIETVLHGNIFGEKTNCLPQPCSFSSKNVNERNKVDFDY